MPKSKPKLPKSSKAARPLADLANSISEAIGFRTMAERRSTGKKMSLADIAQRIGISHVSLNHYKQGKRVPPDHITQKMVDYFYGSDLARAHQFKQVLDEAARIKGRTSNKYSSRQPLDRLAEGEELRVSKNNFEPFSTFLGQTFDRLLELGTLTKTTPPPKGGFDIRDALWRDYTDLAIGYFATVYRSVLVHAWSTPIRLGIGAVIEGDVTAVDKETIQKILTRKVSKSSRFRPIVVANDVGAVHCLNTLKYEANTEAVVVVADDTEKDSTTDKGPNKNSGLVPALLAAFKKLKEEVAGVVPMIVVNEYLSFEVMAAFREKGIPVKPALPLFSREQARESPRRELPAYFLSISCSRKHTQLRDMIQQLLLLFLSTEVEATSYAFAELHGKLLDKLKEFTMFYDDFSDRASQFKAAYNWTLYALGLDRYSIANYPSGGLPWKAILQRTRERVLSTLGDEYDNGTIRDHIRLIAGNDDSLLSEQKFIQLCESLDLDIKLNETQNDYILEDNEILVRTITNALQGQPIPLPIEYYKSGEKAGKPMPGGRIECIRNITDPKNQERLRALEGFLAELNNFYSDHLKFRPKPPASPKDQEPKSEPQAEKDAQKSDVLEKIADFRENLRNFWNADDRRVLLASIGKTAFRFIGSACLRPYEFDKSGKKEALEMFYLWVPKDYRKLAVGEQLIREAKNFAKAQGYQYLVVEVIRTLNDAVTYFGKRNFEHADMYDSRKSERYVMRCKL